MAIEMQCGAHSLPLMPYGSTCRGGQRCRERERERRLFFRAQVSRRIGSLVTGDVERKRETEREAEKISFFFIAHISRRIGSLVKGIYEPS